MQPRPYRRKHQLYTWVGNRWHPAVRGECAYCGGEFLAMKSAVKSGKGLYCSHRCAGKVSGPTTPIKRGEESHMYRNGGYVALRYGVVTLEMRAKRRAHDRVCSALEYGHLKRQPCERCGTTVDVHAHHEDYDKPLDVMWLCRSHHYARHRELEALAVVFRRVPSVQVEVRGEVS